MKAGLIFVWVMSLAVVVVPTVYAEDAVISGPLRFSGAGCLNAEPVVTEDGKTASVLFSDFTVETSKSSRHYYDRNVCEVTVPLTVPAGYKIKVSKLDFRGFKFQSTRYDFSWFLYQYKIKSRNVTKSSAVRTDFQRGSFDDSFFYEPDGSVTSFACGGSMELKIRTEIIAVSACRVGSQTSAAVDSIDFTTLNGGGDFQYIRCQ